MTCDATTRAGGRCKRPAGWGTDHAGLGQCKLHGGSTPNGRKAAMRMQAEQIVAALMDDPDAPRVTDPVSALQELAGRVKHALDEIGNRVNQLTEMRYKASGAGTEQLRAEVAVWERLIGRLHPLLVDMARLGIEDRLARVSERQGEAIVAVLRGAAGDLGMDVEDERVRAAVAAQMRALEPSPN